MISRSRTVATGLLLAVVVLAAAPTSFAVARSTRPAGRVTTDFVGPPLGYYFSVVKLCERSPRLYRRNRQFHNACRQAASIVIHAKRTTACDFFTTLGLIPVGLLPPAQIGVAQSLGLLGLAVACS